MNFSTLCYKQVQVHYGFILFSDEWSMFFNEIFSLFED